MDLESGIIHSALESDEFFRRLESIGIARADFENPGAARTFEFIQKYRKDHDELPKLDAAKSLCRYEIEGQGVSSDFLLKELLKRRLFKGLASAVDAIQNDLRANNPEEAQRRIREFAESSEFNIKRSKPTPMGELGGLVLENYIKIKQGFTGIPLPWPRLSEPMMGLWPGTATYFVGRPAAGKSQIMMVVARHIGNYGKKVLLVSPEMSKVEIAERFFTLNASVSAEHVLRGTLSDFELSKLMINVQDVRDGDDNVAIIDYSDDLTASGMDSAIDEYEPDIVILDSIYMLGFPGNKTDRTLAAADWIRGASKKFILPFMGMHQLSRDATKSKDHGGTGFTTDAIALTDQLFWDAHAVFVIEQNKDMKADRRIRVHIGKLRRGSHDGRPVDINWDFDKMKFDEIDLSESKVAFKDIDYKKDKFKSGFTRVPSNDA